MAFVRLANNMEVLLPILGLAFVGSIIALSGGVLFLFNEALSGILERFAVPFAAGVLVTVSLVGLLPETLDILGESAFLIVLASFVGAYLFEHLLFQVHHHPDHHRETKYKGAIPLIIIGDSIHNFIDGVTIAATYLIAPGLGIITTLSTFMHEVPHEIGDFGILLHAGWKKGKVLWVNVLSASMTLIGALFVILFLRDTSVIGYLLAVSSGIFLYLGASDFLPHIEHEAKKPFLLTASFIIGVLVMLVALVTIPHSHKEEHLENEGYFALETEDRI